MLAKAVIPVIVLIIAGCAQADVTPSPTAAVMEPNIPAPDMPTQQPSDTATPTPADTLTGKPTPTFNLPVTSTLPPITLTFPDTATPLPCIPRADWTDRYIIQPGDTLFAIATRLGLTTGELQTANCIVDANSIFAGTPLRIPPQATATPASS
jgi:LysM repeat protein